jgi:predicted nucleic acid-binding Zn ribbon protein
VGIAHPTSHYFPLHPSSFILQTFLVNTQMSLKSVNDILGVLEIQTKFEEQPFQRLLQCWSEVVGSVIASHARPLSIQRDVLWVATSSAAWAQNLTFERQRLLLKLNQKLDTTLVDIRFSTAGWQRPKDSPKHSETALPQNHPSYLGSSLNIPRNVTPPPNNPNAAFGDWAKSIQARSRNLPLCPMCQCPTPGGELQRWNVCALCSAKRS